MPDEQLQQRYSAMAEQFLAHGMDTKAIDGISGYFDGMQHRRHGQEAKQYTELDSGSLPDNAVRLLVLPLGDAPVMASTGAHLLAAHQMALLAISDGHRAPSCSSRWQGPLWRCIAPKLIFLSDPRRI